MEYGIILQDDPDEEKTKVGLWQASDGMITVVNLGTFPSKTTQLGGLAESPQDLAKLIFSEWP